MKRSLIKILCFSFAGMLVLTTCIDPVDFKTKTPQDTLVVEGQLTTGEKGNYIFLSKVSVYGKTFRVPEAGATVEVINEAGTPIPFVETKPGYYELADPIANKGIAGNTYHLEVTLQDGTKYKTDPEIMPEMVPIDSVFMEISNLSNGQIDISVNTTFPDHPSWLKYKVVENYAFFEIRCSLEIPPKVCYFELPALTPFYLATNYNTTATGLNHYLVASRKRLTPVEFTRGRHYFSVHQFAGTEKANIYFDKLNKLLSLSGGVFDSAPAALYGNLYRDEDPAASTLGYFELASVDTMRVFTTDAMIRQFVYMPDYCDQLGFYTFVVPDGCCDCQNFVGASLQKPDWFE